MVNAKPGQIPELQSIRGLAALVVLLGHCAWFTVEPMPWWYSAVHSLMNGRASVTMFFLLSGTVLTRMLGTEPLRHLREFYLRRLWRIYPAFVLPSLLALLYVLLYPHLAPLMPGDPMHERMLANRFTPLQIGLALVGLGAHLLPQAWTISVELVGSAVMPVLAQFCARHRARTQPLLALMLAVGLTIGPFTPYSVMMYLPAFWIGAWLAAPPPLVRSWLQHWPLKRTTLVLCLVGLVVPRILLNCSYGDPRAYLIELIMATLVLALVLHGRLSIWLLRQRSMQWLGDVSYSLYLFHFPIWMWVGSVVSILFGRSMLGLPPWCFNLSILGLTLAVTLPVSHWSYQVIEQRGIRLGRQMSRPGAIALAEAQQRPGQAVAGG